MANCLDHISDEDVRKRIKDGAIVLSKRTRERSPDAYRKAMIRSAEHILKQYRKELESVKAKLLDDYKASEGISEESDLQPYTEGEVTAKIEREEAVGKKETADIKAAETKRKADNEVSDLEDLFAYGAPQKDIFDIQFSRPDKPELEAIFEGISLPETQRAIQSHPLREKIEYIEANAFDLMNELLQSEKNPNGKVRRIC